jgi:hypothetical protein
MFRLARVLSLARGKLIGWEHVVLSLPLATRKCLVLALALFAGNLPSKQGREGFVELGEFAHRNILDERGRCYCGE